MTFVTHVGWTLLWALPLPSVAVLPETLCVWLAEFDELVSAKFTEPVLAPRIHCEPSDVGTEVPAVVCVWFALCVPDVIETVCECEGICAVVRVCVCAPPDAPSVLPSGVTVVEVKREAAEPPMSSLPARTRPRRSGSVSRLFAAKSAAAEAPRVDAPPALV